MLELPRSEPIDDAEVKSAVAALMILYSSGGNTTVRTTEGLCQRRGRLDKLTRKMVEQHWKVAKVI